MPDEIIEELWKIKDDIAREHGNDVRKIAAYLQERNRHGRSRVAPKLPVAKNASEMKP